MKCRRKREVPKKESSQKKKVPKRLCRKFEGSEGRNSKMRDQERERRKKREKEINRLRPFRYRYRIPVSITIMVSGTVKVLNGTRYIEYPILTSTCRYR